MVSLDVGEILNENLVFLQKKFGDAREVVTFYPKNFNISSTAALSGG